MWRDKYLLKEVILTMALIWCQQMSGAGPIQAYTHHIFTDVSPSISPSLSTIAMGVVQLLTSCFTPILATKLGLKIPLLMSAFGVSTCLVSDLLPWNHIKSEILIF